MRIIYDLDEMTETARGWLTGGSVGLVPVLGNLHAGHLTLVRSSIQECELSIVSILDNSLQGGKQIYRTLSHILPKFSVKTFLPKFR